MSRRPSAAALDALGHQAQGERQPMPWRRIDSVAVVAVAVFSSLLIGLTGHIYTMLSPIDELQHVDYAIKISEFDLVRVNELVGEDAMQEAACRSVDAPGYVSPPCDPSVAPDPSKFQEEGVNTAASSFPVYYFLSGVFGRAVVALTPIDSLVRGIRLSGALWMTLAFASIWALLAELGIRRAQRAVAISVISATPLLVFGFTTVNPDNTLLSISAAIALVTLRFERSAAAWTSVLFVSLAAMIVEPTSVLATLACGTYLLIRSTEQRRLASQRALLGLGLVVGSVPLITLIARLRLEIITPLPDLDFQLPRDVLNSAGPGYITSNLLVSRLRSLVNPISQPYVPDFLSSSVTAALLYFTGVLLLGSGLAAILTLPSRTRIGTICFSAAVWLVIAGPLFTIRWSHSTLPIPARYGLPLLPLMVVGMASVLYKRTALWSVGAFGLISNLYVIYRVVTAI